VHQVSDRFNGNERVFVRQPSKGTHVCVVTLERQLMSGSSFAIVVTGGFGSLPVSQVFENLLNCFHMLRHQLLTAISDAARRSLHWQLRSWALQPRSSEAVSFSL
jgi:hypothetical protein